MYLFVDTETNGIPRNPRAAATDVENWPRLVQIAWILTNEHGSELRAQTFIVRPEGFSVSKRVERDRGITTETALRLGVPIADALKSLARDLIHAEALVAHNVNFDERVVWAEFHRTGRRLNPFSGKKLYCTMRASTQLCELPGPRGYKWPTLAELHRSLFGAGLGSAHDATADVRACAKCFFELKRRGLTDDQDLFEEIYRLADSRSSRTTFVDDVYAQFESRGWITQKQRDALKRIRNGLSGKDRKKYFAARTLQRSEVS